jgi:IS1 family transposase
MPILFLNCVNFVSELHLRTYVHFVDKYIIIKLSSGQNTNPTFLLYTLLVSSALFIFTFDEYNSYTETMREENCVRLKYFS